MSETTDPTAGSITFEHLMGMHSIRQQLDLKSKQAEKFPDNYSPEWLRGYREAYWSANHIIGETLARVHRTDRATYDRFKEATRD